MLPFATFGSGKDKERSVIYQESLFATSAKPEFGSPKNICRRSISASGFLIFMIESLPGILCLEVIRNLKN